MKIHRTAIVSPKAELADDVEVGPYVLIDGHVRIGPGCIIQAHAILGGAVEMGINNMVGYGAAIGGEPQDHAFSPEIRSKVIIGDHNIIREYCTIHRGTTEGSTTEVGSRNYFMSGVHLAHNTKVGSDVTLANSVLLAGYVEVQDRVYVGGRSVFHQFVRVGRVSLIQGNSKFSKDVPPFTIADGHNRVVGLNLRGLRQAGLGQEQRQQIHRAFNLLYRSGLNTTQALQYAKEIPWNAECRELFDFIAKSKRRGYCDLRRPRNSVAHKNLNRLLEEMAVS